MSSFAEEFQRRQKEEKEKQRDSQRKAAAMQQSFRGGGEDGLKLKKQREEERQQKLQAQQANHAYQDTETATKLQELHKKKQEERQKQLEHEQAMRQYSARGMDEGMHELKLRKLREEERQKQRESLEYMKSVQLNEVKYQKKDRPNKSPDQHLPDSERMKHDDDDLDMQAGHVKDKAGLFHHDWSSPSKEQQAASSNNEAAQPLTPDAVATVPVVTVSGLTRVEADATETLNEGAVVVKSEGEAEAEAIPTVGGEKEEGKEESLQEGGDAVAVQEPENTEKEESAEETTAASVESTPPAETDPRQEKEEEEEEEETAPVEPGETEKETEDMESDTKREDETERKVDAADLITTAGVAAAVEAPIDNEKEGETVTENEQSTTEEKAEEIAEVETEKAEPEKEEAQEQKEEAIVMALDDVEQVTDEPMEPKETEQVPELLAEPVAEAVAEPEKESEEKEPEQLESEPDVKSEEVPVEDDQQRQNLEEEATFDEKKSPEEVDNSAIAEKQQLTEPKSKVRLDVLFSFGLLTSSSKPYLDNYMAAVEEVVQGILANDTELANHVRYNPSYGPFVQEYSKDATYEDAAKRKNVQRLLVIAAIPIFLSKGISIKAAREGVCAGLQASMQNGEFIAIAKRRGKAAKKKSKGTKV